MSGLGPVPGQGDAGAGGMREGAALASAPLRGRERPAEEPRGAGGAFSGAEARPWAQRQLELRGAPPLQRGRGQLTCAPDALPSGSSPGPQNLTSFEDRLFKEVVKMRRGLGVRRRRKRVGHRHTEGQPREDTAQGEGGRLHAEQRGPGKTDRATP